MMKREKESDVFEAGTKKVVPRAPPPPPPLPKFRALSRPRAEESVTKREIAKFWRQKQIEEEDHLFAAIKAAARLRARNLSKEDYLSFEESLKTENGEENPVTTDRQKDRTDKEVRVGIKDWWTKSKYAYLNQPAIDSMDPPQKRTSTYIPNCLSYKPKPFYPTTIGVF